MANKKHDYLYKIIQDPVSLMWHAECWINAKLWKITIKMMNRNVVINRLNKIIDSYNLQNSGMSKPEALIPYFDISQKNERHKIIPAMPDDKWKSVAPKPKKMRELPVIPMRKEEPTQTKDATMTTKNTDTKETQTVTIKTQRKKVTPRKPFTPYGLNGYLVDKKGKVRLMLDRKANAKTITLEPEMFSMLANMVQATQAQEMKNE